MRSESLWITFFTCTAVQHSPLAKEWALIQGLLDIPFPQSKNIWQLYLPLMSQRHLWIPLSDILERYTVVVYVDEPVSAENLFGQSFDVIQAKFELRTKQVEQHHFQANLECP